ncbi:F-box/WD repeat-containing protein 4 [Wyeomyia smithii]|uniref:F-box/WD repeat-containing protein 4 n=1 Tax=Wyeomyia smithii TaxID=174621 RepID=UPI0024681ED9|nr:F-box/WD repeat-containing protein 4 [Wyeomyia smithii]
MSYNLQICANICDLNDDALAYIFQHLSLDDLDRLVAVCKRFYFVVNTYVYAMISAHLLRTGHRRLRNSTSLPSRDLHDFSYRKRICLHDNWRYGRYLEKQMFYHGMIYFSQIILESKMLYMTHRGQLRAHKRIANRNDNVIIRKPSWTIGLFTSSDITWMVKKEDLIFTGRMDGSCSIYDRGNRISRFYQLSNSPVTSVDFDGDLFVCTNKSESTTFWSGNRKLDLEKKLELSDGYQTIKLCPNGKRQLAAGRYSDREKKALKLIDVESGKTTTLNSSTRAVYHVLWKDSNTVLTGNFDTTFRVVDTRTSRDEAVWTDPYDASVYCLDYDGAHSVLCGMKYNFRVNSLDLRMPKRCIQMYFSSKMLSHYSPVYSLAADTSQLFIVTDHDLRILNFDADYADKKDYTYDLVKWYY